MARVHTAGFYDDAGFCPGCDAPAAINTGMCPSPDTATVPAVTAKAWTRTRSHRSRRFIGRALSPLSATLKHSPEALADLQFHLLRLLISSWVFHALAEQRRNLCRIR